MLWNLIKPLSQYEDHSAPTITGTTMWSPMLWNLIKPIKPLSQFEDHSAPTITVISDVVESDYFGFR